MPYEVLEQKIKTIPAECVSEVADFIDFIVQRAAAQPRPLPPQRKFGIAKGELSYPDDIDFCNDEIAEMFGVDE